MDATIVVVAMVVLTVALTVVVATAVILADVFKIICFNFTQKAKSLLWLLPFLHKNTKIMQKIIRLNEKT